MKVEDNHYKYRIETKDSNGSIIDFVDIDTVEPLRCAYDIQDELNLETNEHIKRVEEIILNADSTEFWYVDEDRSTDTHLVCYFEEVQLMANANHPMVDTDRSLFEYGKINANEYQDTNFICTHVMPNGVSRIYMSIDKEQLLYQAYTNETIKEYIAQNPITIWYAIRYPVAIPRSMSKGHLLTLDGQTDISISTTGERVGLPIVKFNVGDTQYTMDNNPIHISNSAEGTQIRNIVLEGNTPINYARGNGVSTTEATSDSRYDFDPFYDGQTTIQGTVEGGYVSAKLYGDTMVNIAKPYGETPLLTATSDVTLCDDLLGMNEESIVLADGEIAEGRIYGDSAKTENPTFKLGNLVESNGIVDTSKTGDMHTEMMEVPPRTFSFYTGRTYTKIAYYDANRSFISCQLSSGVATVKANIPSNAKYVRYGAFATGNTTEDDFTWKYLDGTDVYEGIESVVNPSVYMANENLVDPSLFRKGVNIALTDGGVMVDGDTSVGWQSFYNNTTAIKLLANHTYKLRAFLLEGEYTGGNFKYSLSNNTGKEIPYTNTHTIVPKTDVYLTALSFFAPQGIGAKFGISLIETTDDLDTYIPHHHTQFTSNHTLNKLPNGVADYIDVVNKVHVQRVGKVVLDGSTNNIVTRWMDDSWNFANDVAEIECSIANLKGYSDNYTISTVADKIPSITWNDAYKGGASGVDRSEGIVAYVNGRFVILLSTSKVAKSTTLEEKLTYLQSNPITVLYELATPIYTPLTDEEIAQLPLSAYADGYVMLSSDQLTPSFEFRMRASNRYQVDMLETGYYYLNAPVGNVKLGTVNVDVQQMPCIVKVDNVGTGDGGYRLGFEGEGVYFTYGKYVQVDGDLLDGSDVCSDYLVVTDRKVGVASDDSRSEGFGICIAFYDESRKFMKRITSDPAGTVSKSKYFETETPSNAKYCRISYRAMEQVSRYNSSVVGAFNPITLTKLPSHRIPSPFTQGMKCGTDFGYWEGIIESSGSVVRTNNTKWEQYDYITIPTNMVARLNRIEFGSTIVEDELDLTTGKFTKRVEGIVLDGLGDEDWKIWNGDNANTYMFCYQLDANGSLRYSTPIICDKFKGSGTWNDTEHVWINEYNKMLLHIQKDRLGNNTVDALKQWLQQNPIVIYYALAVPKISYIPLNNNVLKTPNNGTILFVGRHSGTLNAQCKPSHLTYPVPSLVANREYTVVHNRKNISGSTKPITLDLGGTQVELNDTSGKTLVKTPSSLKHSSLIFIGGESTVDHVMVLDGDWTNKPIEYFENMMGHDTDAIITIIGNGQIDDVEEQYLW